MTLADLGRKSVRRNALIADLLHRIEFIEKAGTGIKRIRDEVREQGCPEPEFEANGFFTAIFRPNPQVRSRIEAQSKARLTGQVTGHVAGEVTAQVPHKYRTSTAQVALFCREPRSARELMAHLQLRHWKTFQANYLTPLIQAGLLEMTVPDKPRSSKQRYRLTRAGIEYLKTLKEKR